MHVQVRHAFAAVAAVVDDDPITRLGDAEFFRQRRGGQEQVTEHGLVGGRGLADSRDEFLRMGSGRAANLAIAFQATGIEALFASQTGAGLKKR